MSGTHTYRVVVRGLWRDLTDQDRERLLAEVDQHDDVQAFQFTPDGSVAYDRSLRNFSIRYVIESDPADGDEMAAALAEERAEGYLTAHGYQYQGLRSSVTDMDTMKINR